MSKGKTPAQQNLFDSCEPASDTESDSEPVVRGSLPFERRMADNESQPLASPPVASVSPGGTVPTFEASLIEWLSWGHG